MSAEQEKQTTWAVTIDEIGGGRFVLLNMRPRLTPEEILGPLAGRFGISPRVARVSGIEREPGSSGEG